MATGDLPLERFLGPRALAVIDGIPDPRGRKKAISSIQVCAEALRVIDALDLTEHELSEVESADLSVWNAVAPDVRNIMVAARRAIDTLRECFPAHDQPKTEVDESSIDDAFDMMEEGTLPEPIRDRRALEFDFIVEDAAEDEIGLGVASLAGMLEEDLAQFGQRLRNPTVVSDRWFLLGELQELTSKCAQCFEAVVATVMRAYSDQNVEELLPRYTSATTRALRLRRAIVDLGAAVNAQNDVVAQGDADVARQVFRSLMTRLIEFSESEAYRYLRPTDKREILRFRIFLKSWDAGDRRLRELQQQVEGFAKFLDVMRAINHRQELKQHDLRYLNTAKMVLDAGIEVEGARTFIEMAYGRNRDLDEALRKSRHAEPPAPETMLELVSGALQELQASLF